MPDQAFIYALLDPETRLPRYVGHSRDPEARCRDHWRQRGSARNKQRNPGFSAWLCSLSVSPDYRIIGMFSWADRIKWEKFYTDRLREAPGVELLNILSGQSHPDVSVGARLAAAGHTPEARAKRSATLIRNGTLKGENNHRYGKSLPSETRAKISASLTGRVASDETRAKLSAAAEAREARHRREGMIRVPKSPEHRARIGASLRARNARLKESAGALC